MINCHFIWLHKVTHSLVFILSVSIKCQMSKQAVTIEKIREGEKTSKQLFCVMRWLEIRPYTTEELQVEFETSPTDTEPPLPSFPTCFVSGQISNLWLHGILSQCLLITFCPRLFLLEKNWTFFCHSCLQLSTIKVTVHSRAQPSSLYSRASTLTCYLLVADCHHFHINSDYTWDVTPPDSKDWRVQIIKQMERYKNMGW